MTILYLLILGLCAGILGGLLGIGGGVILVPSLLLLAKLEIHQAIGVSIAVIVPTALVSAVTHYQLGHIDLRIALVVAAGGMVGAFLGASWAELLPALTLKRIFGVTLIFVGFNMAFNWTGAVVKDAVKDASAPPSAKVNKG